MQYIGLYRYIFLANVFPSFILEFLMQNFILQIITLEHYFCLFNAEL